MKPLAMTIDTYGLLSTGAPVAVGISGGKDSCAVALAVNEHLDAMMHSGPRLLVHADLGRTEWKASLPTCERLAKTLNQDLLIVRREAGDMMDRWLTRWKNNVARYSNLECVKLILPWSTPSMRFCTSEMKTAVICRGLADRFQTEGIISVCGIRRQESPGRAKAVIFKEQPKLRRTDWDAKKKRSVVISSGFDWNAILDWTTDDVFTYLAERHFALHEAYTTYGSSRVSCVFCIMSSEADLLAASACQDNHDIYRLMVDLEIDSTFSFQSGKWLGDVAPHLLDQPTRQVLSVAKEAARLREESESRIPEQLLYTKGWPTVMPMPEEADLIADVRTTVAGLVSIPDVKYRTGEEVYARYAELMAKKAASA